MRTLLGWLLLVLPLTGAGVARAQDVDAGPPDVARPDGGSTDEGPPAPPRLTPPRLIESPPLNLPEDAEPLPEDASVELLVVVAPDGTVSEAQVFAPLREDVDALAIEAAQGMRFEPATRDGVPIPARIRFRYRVTPPAPPAPDPGEEPDLDAGAPDPDAGESGPGDPDASGTEDIDLASLEADVEPLGVTAEVERPEPGAADRVTLRAEELTTVPGTFGEPLRVVATLPGVVRSPFGLGFFLVRGAAFQNTGFLVDGFPIPILYHFGAGPAVISSRLVERLDFYPGGYPATFGRFSAGVVALGTAPPPTDGARGELSIDLFRASALVVVPFDDGRGSVAAAFRRSYYELLLPLVLPGLNIAFTDYQVRADYRVNSRMQLSLFVFGSDDRLDQTGTFGSGVASEGVQNRLSQDFQRAIASIKLRLPHQARLTIAGMIGRDGTGFSNAEPGTDGLEFGLQNIYFGLRTDLQLPWNEWLQTNVGFDINTTVFDINASAFVPNGLGQYPAPRFSPQSSDLDLAVVRALAAFYIDQIIRLGPVEISASGRFDYMRYADVSDVYPDPRLVVRWQVVPELLLKLATGLFTQPPPAFNVARLGGSPNLPPNRAWQSSVGAEVTFPERIEVRTTAFYSQMFDIIRQTNRTVIDDNGEPQRQFFVADQEGRAYGLELMIRRRIEEGLYGWLSYTLSRSERRTDSGRWVPFGFDQTHTLNLAASYAFDGWRFGAAFQLSTGRPTSSPRNPVFIDENAMIAVDFVDEGERIATFTRLDLRIDRDFEIGPIEGSVYLDIQNVYNAPNNEGTLYQWDYQATAPVPGLPIIPTIGVTGAIQ